MIAQWNSRSGLRVKGTHRANTPRVWHLQVLAVYETVIPDQEKAETVNLIRLLEGTLAQQGEAQPGDVIKRKMNYGYTSKTPFLLSDLAQEVGRIIDERALPGEIVEYAAFTAIAR